MNTQALTDLAVDVVNRYDDEQLWNEFFSTWMHSGRPVKPGHSGARMAAELLAAEVVRLRKVEQANREAPIVMALCEASRVMLHPNQLYRFIVIPDCAACAKAAAQSHD